MVLIVDSNIQQPNVQLLCNCKIENKNPIDDTYFSELKLNL